MNMHHITTDVLIMGGGSAGLWAAYRCSELAPEARICIVDKGPRDWGGLMTMAGGDFEAVLPPDNVDEWVRDFIYYFDGLCDQDLMEEILKRSADRLHDYERFGCEFFKKEDGSMKYVPQRGLDHVKLYPAQLKGRGGELMVKNIVRQLKQRSVERVGRILLTELLQQDGRVCGALGFDTINGDFYRFDARVVIAASGMGGWKTSYGKNTPTGETMQMTYEAGAVLQNLEFARVWNMPRLFGWEGQTVLMPLGARFVNAEGEPFMERYSPVLGHMAGENAARLLQTLPEVKSDLSDAEITARQQALFAPLGKEGLTPKEVLTSIQKTVFPYGVSILKNERSLQAALKELERIREEDLPRMVATDPHYLLKLHETRGVAFVSEMYVRASLERKETRAGHYREDYPVRDDSQLAWLCLRKDADSKPEFFRVPVPLEKYKHPVTRYYQDNFAFPTSESAK